MQPKRSGDENDLRIVGFGFGLTILLLLGSAYAAIQAVEAGQSRMLAFAQEQQITDKLTGEIQGEEAGLTTLFYSLERSLDANERLGLLVKLSTVERDIERTFTAAKDRSDAARWQPARRAVEQFTSQMRTVFGGSTPSRTVPDELYRSHEAVVSELAKLVADNYESAVVALTHEHDLRRGRLRNALYLLLAAVVLSTVCAVTTMRKANSILRHARWQASELSRLSGHVLETQDSVVRRLSRELHDEFGQTLGAIEANLAAIPANTPDQQSRIEDCLLLVKDAMGNVRELSQLLRPSILDDFGLQAGLQWLCDSFRQRNGIAVESHIAYDSRLPGETETHLFRIAQEALTNVARHSGATHVELSLALLHGKLKLTVSDNGKGLTTPAGGRTGFGMMGMRERMRAAGGELRVHSPGKGLTIEAEVPVEPAGERA